MPMPIGGMYALARHGGRISYGSGYDTNCDPVQEEYLQRKKHIQENLKCKVKLLKTTIPPEGGKLEGALILEAKEDVEHAGLFLLVKGQSLRGKKKIEQQKSNVKFMVLEGSGDGGEVGKIEGGKKERFQLELDIPRELTTPVITPEGKLQYRLQAWLSIPGDAKGKHVWLGDTSLRWMGRRIVTREERRVGLVLKQNVEGKRGLMGLGRKRVAEVEWRVNRAGFVPGEWISLELSGATREKAGMELEWTVELVQKVWYQVLESGGKLGGKLKFNCLEKAEGQENVEGGCTNTDAKQSLWSARIKVPKRITPTCEWDLDNCVHYVIKFKVGLKGETKQGWVNGELPVVVGTSKEMVQGEDYFLEEEEDEEENGGCRAPEEIGGARGQCENTRIRQRNTTFVPGWPGSELISSTLSMLRMPPSYSQLSLRRPTVETMPPAYDELELQEQGPSAQVSSSGVFFSIGTPQQSQDNLNEAN